MGRKLFQQPAHAIQVQVFVRTLSTTLLRVASWLPHTSSRRAPGQGLVRDTVTVSPREWEGLQDDGKQGSVEKRPNTVQGYLLVSTEEAIHTHDGKVGVMEYQRKTSGPRAQHRPP